jgi:hypothetical protein
MQMIAPRHAGAANGHGVKGAELIFPRIGPVLNYPDTRVAYTGTPGNTLDRQSVFLGRRG